jgi:hypothetical protein
MLLTCSGPFDDSDDVHLLALAVLRLLETTDAHATSKNESDALEASQIEDGRT